jgi:enamine deaminase RidA (YjgF/YER057c/UK114 family)
MEELLIDGAHIDASLIAVVPDSGLDPRQARADDVPVPPGSGFVPSLAAGDYVFVAGQMANDEAMTGLAKGAARAPTSVWGGTDIRLQTEFLIVSRLLPALKAAGSSLENAIKAQVYLTDIADLPDFLEVWNKYFSDNPCALTVLPTSGLGSTETIVEINILALRDAGKTRKQIVEHKGSAAMRFGAAAIRAGDLLCLSGLFAADDKGAIPASTASAAMKHFGAGPTHQMQAILRTAEEICGAAGTSLTQTLRAHHFFGDLTAFSASQKAWQRAVPGMPVPFGAVRVPAPLPVPGCDVTVDLWIYCPMD